MVGIYDVAIRITIVCLFTSLIPRLFWLQFFAYSAVAEEKAW